MKYKRCMLCEINYVDEDEEICKFCKAQKSVDDGEGLETDVCPFCEKNLLDYGEEKCKKCREKVIFVANYKENV